MNTFLICELIFLICFLTFIVGIFLECRIIKAIAALGISVSSSILIFNTCVSDTNYYFVLICSIIIGILLYLLFIIISLRLD